ncbi:MAG: ATP--cob(I)alamin adenosyltransferase [Patescibacteria group bacterium]|nr:MAG: ATP--cob(I)alamin adenosyltransferase [Patescibacteria group bacterium]
MPKLYTKTGDSGTSSLFSGKRLSKSDRVFEALGQVDELNALISLGLSKNYFKKFKNILLKIQHTNYLIMAVLAGDKRPIVELKELIDKIEQNIDFILSKKNLGFRFLLFNTSLVSAEANFLRVSARKTERVLVSFFKKNQQIDNRTKLLILSYINRLSDFFFAVAVWYDEEKTELTREI